MTPLYPYRDGDITYWPVGTFDTVLAGPELALAHSRGHILRYHSWSEYVCAPALRSIAEALYNWRCKAERLGDGEMKSVAKLMYVSLVGQLAKRDWLWESCDDADNDILYGEWHGTDGSGSVCRYRAIAGRVEREVSAGLSADTMPAMAAFVTSEARVRLLELIEIAGWDHVYYCDTDAIMVDAYGREALYSAGMVSPDSLGGLGERWGPCRVDLRGIKWYTVDGKLVCAGIIDNSGLDDAGEGCYWHTETPKEAVRRRHRPNARVRAAAYVRDSVYRHGVVHDDGRITPIVLECG